MTRSFRLLPIAAAAAAALLLQGCGGGDDDEASSGATGPTVTLSGVVLDGALRTAKVCVDLDDDRVCGANEPQATTDANGAYSIADVRESDAAAHPVLAEAAATTTVDADYGPVVDAFTLAAPAGQHAVVTPFTTLIQSEIDGGRAANLVQAQENIVTNLVGIAGDVGGLTLQSNYLPVSGEATALATRRDRMYGLAQVLAKGFAETKKLALAGTAATGALGQAATGSLQIVASQVNGKLSLADRDSLATAQRESLVPTAANLANVAAAAAKTTAAPIEGAWIRTTGAGATAKRELYLFAGDGTFVHQTIETGAPTTSTAFDDGFGYRYGRYTLANGTLTTTLIEAAEAAGPGNGTLANVTITGNTMTAGGLTLERVASATEPLVGGWIRPNGAGEPEYLVLLADGTYVHGTFYYQNDPQTGTASFFQTARSVGLRKGTYARAAAGSGTVNFGTTTVAFNGNLAIPSDPGVGSVQPDGSLSLTGLRLVKLGTEAGAKAVSGFSESTRARIWSGRYFSRNVTVAGATRLQYVYVRGPKDVVTFLQAPAGSDATIACGSTAATTQGAVVDFTGVGPEDGKLKHFVVGTGTAATAGYAQRRLHVGQPGAGNFVTYTPIARPTNATARCALPL
jgi:hypothetical protein